MTKHKGERKPTKKTSKAPGDASRGGTKKAESDKKDKKAKQFDHHDFGKGQTAGKHRHVVTTRPESKYDHIGEDLMHEAAIAHRKSHQHQHLHQKHPTGAAMSSPATKTTTKATVTGTPRPTPLVETKPATVPTSTE